MSENPSQSASRLSGANGGFADSTRRRRRAGPLPGGSLPGQPGADVAAALYATLLTLVRRDGRDLTCRQLATFMTVYRDPQLHSVSSMAELLNVSRPAVTRIVDRLAEFELVERQDDPYDRRRVLIRRTPRGGAFLRDLEEISGGGLPGL